jgi:hypothetical protein
MPYTPVSSRRGLIMCFEIAYVWHYGLPIFTLHVAKGHLRTLVLVDAKFRVVDIWDLVERDFGGTSLELLHKCEDGH